MTSSLPSSAAHLAPFALKLRGWTKDIVLFTNGAVEIAGDVRGQLETARIRIETAPIAQLTAHDGHLEAVQLATGKAVPCDALFTHPPQRHVDLVRSLDVALDQDGYVKVDPMTRETSVRGIYASGDLTTRAQGAVFAAAAGAQAAAMMNMELTMELVSSGAL